VTVMDSGRGRPRHAPESFSEIVCLRRRRAQRVERRPPLLHGRRKPRLKAVPWPRRIRMGSVDGSSASSATSLLPLDRLQERVVEVARQPGAFCQSLIEARTDGSRNCRTRSR